MIPTQTQRLPACPAALIPLLLIAAVPSPAAGAGQSSSVVAQAAAAVDELRSAARAVGISDIESLSALSWQSDGTLYSPNQGRRPDAGTEWKLAHRQFADFDSGVTYISLGFTGPESSFSRSTALRQDSGSGDLLELMAPFPHSVLRLLASRPADLRLERSDGSGAVISGPMIDRTVELELGPDQLPRSLSYVITDSLFGDSIRRFDYLDYRRENGLLIPRQVRQTDAGRAAHDIRIASSAVNAVPPDWSKGLTPRQAHAPADSEGFRAERIASGIYHLRQIGAADYHALGVELPDGWMLLETPGAIADGEAVRSALRDIADKPIIYAAPTHHHDDHSTGVTAFAEEQVTVLTTTGNVDYFRTMLAAQRGFSKPEVRARVIAVEPDQRIGPVQFVQISALPHVEEMLLFYLPEQKILFHSDLGRFNPDGAVEPARAQTCALLALIESRRDLPVERIYSGHGMPGTVEDLRKAIDKREQPCP